MACALPGNLLSPTHRSLAVSPLATRVPPPPPPHTHSYYWKKTTDEVSWEAPPGWNDANGRVLEGERGAWQVRCCPVGSFSFSSSPPSLTLFSHLPHCLRVSVCLHLLHLLAPPPLVDPVKVIAHMEKHFGNAKVLVSCLQILKDLMHKSSGAV